MHICLYCGLALRGPQLHGDPRGEGVVDIPGASR